MVRSSPVLSVVIPTHDNVDVLRRCLDSWRRCGGESPLFELIVVEDGCADSTPDLLAELSATTWGGRHLRWLHTDDVHELRCTNAGLAAAGAPLLMAWQDDMFLRARWLVPELVRVFERCADIGLLSLGRGLDHHPSADPIDSWDALNDWSRLSSTIGPRGWNWVRLQECDSVVRPWIVRRACLDRVGPLDDAFAPTEWDEADLSFRIRDARWQVATCGYERLGAYEHLGSSTVGTLSDAYRARVLKNGRLFHARWDAAIARDHARRRRTWFRPQAPRVWTLTCAAAVRTGWRRLVRAPRHPGTLAPWPPGTWRLPLGRRPGAR